jgi:hypothetical protein
MSKKILCIISLVLSGFIHNNVSAQSAPIRIQFARGAISAEWRGNIYAGYQAFRLILGKNQRFSLQSGEVYTWSMITPTGDEIGCNGYSSCNSGDTIFLPMSGDYIVRTTYRMDSGYKSPVASSRLVNVVFAANQS